MELKNLTYIYVGLGDFFIFISPGEQSLGFTFRSALSSVREYLSAEFDVSHFSPLDLFLIHRLKCDGERLRGGAYRGDQ